MLRILLSSLICSTYICTDANVAIQRQSKEYAECGRSLTLTCTIQKYDFAMSWLTGNDTIKIAKCIEHNCDQNPNYFGKYNFSFDVERGVFNLTIVKVTTEDKGRVFVCSDGTDVDSRHIKIRGYEPMLLEDIGAGRVMATSGCVSNVTHVSFKWIKISTINGIEEEFIPTIHSNYLSKCSNESDCWTDEHMQYNMIIHASQSDNGQHYLKMIAIYGNELKESSITTYKYFIGGKDDEDEDHEISTQHLAIIIMVAVSLFLFFLALILYFLRKKLKRSLLKCTSICGCRKAALAVTFQSNILNFFKTTSKGDGKLENHQLEKIERYENNLQRTNETNEIVYYSKRSLRNLSNLLRQTSSEENTDIEENEDL